MNLKNKLVLITGGAKGIGLATAQRILNEGGKVILWDFNEDDLNKTVNNFKDKGYINVLTKEEEFITQSDKKGVKIFGSFDDSKKEKKFNYSTIIFISDQNLIEVITVYEQKNDIVEQIVKRIENSIDFING